jgi:hypothetical protein
VLLASEASDNPVGDLERRSEPPPRFTDVRLGTVEVERGFRGNLRPTEAREPTKGSWTLGTPRSKVTICCTIQNLLRLLARIHLGASAVVDGPAHHDHDDAGGGGGDE